MDIRSRIASRIRIAREQVGLKQEEVAEQLNIARQTLSRIEHGEAAIDSDLLVRLASIYDRPITFFYDERSGEGFNVVFRADTPELLDARLKNRLLDKLTTLADLEVAAGVKAGHGLPPSEPLHKAGSAELAVVKQFADRERGRLGIGPAAPVADIVDLLEGIEIRIIPFELAPADIEGGLLSGFSAFSENLGAGIFVNTHPSISVERQIFSITHEYAYLIFHRQGYRMPAELYKTRGKNTSPEEKIANFFAGNFLVPEAALRRNIFPDQPLNVTDVLRLKRLFRVSFATMVTRLAQEKLINKKNENILWAVWNRRGWKTQEPEPIQQELGCGRRTLVLARHAFERKEASLSFIGDLLDMPRKNLADLIKTWEEEAHLDAVQ